MVQSVSSPISLQAGEYRLYTSKRLSFTQEILSNSKEADLAVQELNLFPNPSSGSASLQFYLDEGRAMQIQIFAADGSLLYTAMQGTLPSGAHQIPLAIDVVPGLYFVQLSTSGGKITMKWTVTP